MEHPIDALTALATELLDSKGCIQEVGLPGNGELAEIAGACFVAHGVWPRALRLRVPSVGEAYTMSEGKSATAAQGKGSMAADGVGNGIPALAVAGNDAA